MQPDWSEPNIERQLHSQRTVHIRLAEPLVVYLSYLTAKVEDGKIWFFEDLYGHDRKPLQQAALPSEVVATLAAVRNHRRSQLALVASGAAIAGY